MTYLKILMYARAGIQAKIDEYRGMQEKALEGAGSHAGAQTLARKCQDMIDDLEVDMATIDELQEIHDRKGGGHGAEGLHRGILPLVLYGGRHPRRRHHCLPVLWEASGPLLCLLGCLRRMPGAVPL